MRYPKLRELKEAIRALIKGPYTCKFPNRPYEPPAAFRGKPEFHEEDCIGCAACVQVCPARAIEFKDEIKNSRAKRILTISWDTCIFCGQCEANCPTAKGIKLSLDYDLSTTEKRQDLKQAIEKDLITCECCNEPIAPYDQFRWVADRLGPFIFSNASLLLVYLRSLYLAVKEKSAIKKVPGLKRADRIKILCPRCRREAALKS